jgi:hypothetical protein
MPSPYQLNTFPSTHFHHQQNGHFPIYTQKGHLASFRTVFRNLFAKNEEVVEENNDYQPPLSHVPPPLPPLIPPLPPILQAPQSPQLSPMMVSESKLLGAPGGPEIANKNTILGEIDEALGVRKPPAIEFIFVEPYPV